MVGKQTQPTNLDAVYTAARRPCIRPYGDLRTTKLCDKQMNISKLFSCVNPFSSQIYKICPYTDLKQNIHVYTNSKQVLEGLVLQNCAY